jgi:hypothetical protein
VSLNGRGNGALQKLGGAPEAVLARAFPRAGDYSDQLLWSVSADEWEKNRAAATRPFSAPDAEQKIRTAIEQVQQKLNSHAEVPAIEAPPLYPFFITDSGAASRPCATCGAARDACRCAGGAR